MDPLASLNDRRTGSTDFVTVSDILSRPTNTLNLPSVIHTKQALKNNVQKLLPKVVTVNSTVQHCKNNRQQ